MKISETEYFVLNNPAGAAKEIDRLREALQVAADSFRSHGFAVDADEAEAALAGTSVQPSADPIIHAQHDETGRTWTGPRSQMPRRYFECCTQDAYAEQMRPTDTAPAPAPQPTAALDLNQMCCPACGQPSGKGVDMFAYMAELVTKHPTAKGMLALAMARAADNAAAPAPQPSAKCNCSLGAAEYRHHALTCPVFIAGRAAVNGTPAP